MAKKKQIKMTSPPPVKDVTPYNTEMRGIFFFIASFILTLSLLSFAYGQASKNWLGLIGHTIGWIFHALFGLSSYLIVIFLGWISWRLLFNQPINRLGKKTLAVAILVCSTSILLSLIEEQFPTIRTFLGHSFYTYSWYKKQRYHLGGALFYYLYRDMPTYNLVRMLNTTGVGLVFFSTLVASLLSLAKITPEQILQALTNFFTLLKETTKEKWEALFAPREPEEEPFSNSDKMLTPFQAETDETEHFQERGLKNRPSFTRRYTLDPILKSPFDEMSRPVFSNQDSHTEPEEEILALPQPTESPDSEAVLLNKKEAAINAQKIYNGDFTHYEVPEDNLLTNPKSIDHTLVKKDLERQAEILEETLLSFGIEAKVGQIHCGPTITLFEVHPAIGVKVQKIRTLENDIALNMQARSIRIIAPIPGKAAVGIEVPSPHPQEVAFKDILHAYQQGGKKFHIPVLLGKTVLGEYVMSDLAKMPHCIIAGATGSGKSVCINTIVMSILLNAKPDEIKLLMIDPKKVELTPYTRLPHMLAPVITEPHGACAALNWLVKEMENRYELLKILSVRNIESFNQRKRDIELEESFDREIPEKLPYIVGIIDELADLMMVSSSDIETPIARIAQMARAVGIHLILATQRPSREVITGIIKANFPTRISFKVASRVNSQIVLDETGAESLLGNGDMLFLPPGSSHLIRAQGAYIRDEDITGVVKKICDQAPPNYVIDSFDQGSFEDFQSSNQAESPADQLYDSALDIVLSTGNASTTFLQRKLKIGYARAASLIDLLENQGVIGPSEGSKPRKILLSRKNGGEETSPKNAFALEDE
ncbi:DNA translocase FtsK [Parachlamydia sp. AcF125]|uniref:FtsK/SpoIIIE family DNA translocase n=1 Tax=Parachlamydia sp. AcF125 TaxID=2795736 RepID=UPI001BC96662|nr:DNA translocase FtsK [Parachlamydia sp. AcF125]MBS4167551.1 DNA translocase FtsK [Parachlamydia sp. AcF125]